MVSKTTFDVKTSKTNKKNKAQKKGLFQPQSKQPFSIFI
ncbi:MAG: hypothetical protein RLZZ540_198 [Bacteroidota bacterium]|jgi:hypothetical protein